MTGDRLPLAKLEGVLASWPEGLRDLALATRALVLEVAPGLAETIAFGALCYYKAGAAYGTIGGNVCLIDEKRGALRLAFLHGASLPDPEGLLEGTAKAKRDLGIRDLDDLRRPAVADLIRAAVAHDPASGDS